jgi:hypothetical protein
MNAKYDAVESTDKTTRSSRSFNHILVQANRTLLEFAEVKEKEKACYKCDLLPSFKSLPVGLASRR